MTWRSAVPGCSPDSYPGGGRRDGNGDGNPGHRARSLLNGDVRLTSTTAIPTGAPLHLESKCMPRYATFST
jgi:hypothetical protein